MSRNNRRHLLVVSSMLLLILISVVYGVISWTGASTDKQKRIIVVIKSIDPTVEFWQVLMDGVQEAAQEFGVIADVRGAGAETEVEEQIRIVEEAIAEGPDAIVLAATDVNRLIPVSKKVKENGIRLLTMDSGIDADIAQSLVATNNVKAGQAAGREMMKHLRGPSKIAIISYVKNAASHIDREEGVRAVLADSPRIDIIGTYYAEGLEGKAYSTMKQLLESNPDLKGIIGLNEPSTVGAGRAIQELGMKDQVKLIGFDSSVNEVKLLEEGVMQATIIQKPFQMGYLSVKAALEAIQGHKIPKRIDTGSVVITKHNMYEEENQKLLFPFVNR